MDLEDDCMKVNLAGLLRRIKLLDDSHAEEQEEYSRSIIGDGILINLLDDFNQHKTGNCFKIYIKFGLSVFVCLWVYLLRVCLKTPITLICWSWKKELTKFFFPMTSDCTLQPLWVSDLHPRNQELHPQFRNIPEPEIFT